MARSVKRIKGTDGLYERDGIILVKLFINGKVRKLSLGMTVTPDNIKKATKQQAVMETEITAGVFDMEKWFPKNRAVRKVSKKSVSKSGTVSEVADLWWAAWTEDNTPTTSTLDGYFYILENHIKAKIGHMMIIEVTLEDLLEWEKSLKHKNDPTKRLGLKKINDISTLMSRIFKYAEAHRIFGEKKNPWTEFEAWRDTRKGSLRKDKKAGRARSYLEPFTKSERLAIVENFPEEWQSERNMIGFNFAMGLRIGELMGLAWEDIDFDNATVKVHIQRQETYFSRCKAGSDRILDLSDEALVWLKAQKKIAHVIDPVDIVVREHKRDKHGDMMETEYHGRHMVFYNSVTGSFYRKSGDFSTDKWPLVLERAGVNLYDAMGEKRVPYYTRHTFASRMLTAHASMEEIARELGNSVAATEKCYACLITEDRISTAPKKNEYLSIT